MDLIKYERVIMNCMLLDRLGTDVARRISSDVHRMCMRDVCDEIRSRISPIELAFRSGDSFEQSLDTLRDRHEVRRVDVDAYYYWTTVVVFLDDARFVMAHDYHDGPHMYQNDFFVVEGLIENVTSIKIERFFHAVTGQGSSSPGRRKHDSESLTEHLTLWQNEKIMNMIPFQFVMEMGFAWIPHFESLEIDYGYDSGKKWTDPWLVFDRLMLARV